MNAKPSNVTAFDVAEYIIRKRGGTIRALKLQKLVYYSQAWSLVWDEAPLFGEKIEAWRKGPVVPQLYFKHEKQLDVATVGGNADALCEAQRKTVDDVLLYYGSHTSEWLCELTHRERPWKDARGDLAPEARGNAEITLESMAEYYECQPPGGPQGEVDLECMDLEQVLKAEAEVRRGEVVDWEVLDGELQDQAREIYGRTNQGAA